MKLSLFDVGLVQIYDLHSKALLMMRKLSKISSKSTVVVYFSPNDSYIIIIIYS
jgi:hypothetical protein